MNAQSPPILQQPGAPQRRPMSILDLLKGPAAQAGGIVPTSSARPINAAPTTQAAPGGASAGPVVVPAPAPSGHWEQTYTGPGTPAAQRWVADTPPPRNVVVGPPDPTAPPPDNTPPTPGTLVRDHRRGAVVPEYTVGSASDPNLQLPSQGGGGGAAGGAGPAPLAGQGAGAPAAGVLAGALGRAPGASLAIPDALRPYLPQGTGAVQGRQLGLADYLQGIVQGGGGESPQALQVRKEQAQQEAAQSSLAASAGTPAALRNAMNNIGGIQASGASEVAAREQQAKTDATNSLASLLGNTRAGDIGEQGQIANAALGATDLGMRGQTADNQNILGLLQALNQGQGLEQQGQLGQQQLASNEWIARLTGMTQEDIARLASQTQLQLGADKGGGFDWTKLIGPALTIGAAAI